AAAGLVAGAVTGLINVVIGIDILLGGILVTTGLYTAQLYIMGGGNRSLVGARTLPGIAEEAWHSLRLPESVMLGATPVPAALFSALLVFAVLVLFSV